jgi:hypothetical protein
MRRKAGRSSVHDRKTLDGGLGFKKLLFKETTIIYEKVEVMAMAEKGKNKGITLPSEGDEAYLEIRAVNRNRSLSAIPKDEVKETTLIMGGFKRDW